MKLNFHSGFFVLILIGMVVASEDAVHNFYGEGAIENGQIFRGNTRNIFPLDRAWVQDFYGWLGDSIAINERTAFRFQFGLGTRLTYNYLVDSTSFANWANRFPVGTHILDQAHATHIFGNVAERNLTVTYGIFHYKYNPDVKNLGEYLFRSMCYPNFINAFYDFPLARLVGLKLSSRLFDGALTSDFIVSSEADMFPFNDVSLTLVEGINIGKFLSIGAGVQGYHILQVDPKKTNPVTASINSPDAPGWYYAKPEDTATATFAGKKSFYTFSGTKLMARLNISPLSDAPPVILPVIGTLFGANDCKFYAEASVLGLKNHPIFSTSDSRNLQFSTPDPKYYEYYNHLLERIPVTFGINAPTNPIISCGLIPMAAALFARDHTLFDKKTITYTPLDTTGGRPAWDTAVGYSNDLGKRLPWVLGSAVATGAVLSLQNRFGLNLSPDIFSFEFEYYTNRFANSYQNVFADFVPIPEVPRFKSINPSYQSLKHNRWRWSVNTVKTFDNYFIKLQIAHDHRLAFMVREDLSETNDALGAAGLWQWTLKTGVVF